MTVLPIARYRFTFRMRDSLCLPEYAGSLLRGQFGASLRSVACMTGSTSCTGCRLLRTCPYPAIFETPAPEAHAMQKFSQVPNPYVIEPPAFGTRKADAGEDLRFALVLIGRAIDQLPLVAFALQRALEAGVGKERARGELALIEWQDSDIDSPTCWRAIWQPQAPSLAPHGGHVSLSASTSPRRVRLHIDTPMRLQHQGHPVRAEALTPRKLIADLLRRATLLFDFHADRPDLVQDASALTRHAETLSHEQRLRWLDWSRYSSRQQREMTLGGVVGEWTFKGDLSPLLPWLKIGQWLHVGKNATMGMGGYRLETT